jgi:hypothetical protein
MSVTEPSLDVMLEVTALLLDALVIALSLRGLAAERRGSRMIAATPSSAEGPSDNPAAVLGERQRQTVICLADHAGRLSWFWVRASTGRAAVDLEYLGPTGHIRATADRIARVLLPEGLIPEPAI